MDRDGVLNQRIIGSYVLSIEDFRILPGVLEALYYANDLFYCIVVVTNQQCIGKGLLTHENLKDIHDHFIHEVEGAKGRIDEIYYSPDLAYVDSHSRKPETGMALQAQKDFVHMDFTKSIMVGDSQSDIDFGNKLGMVTVYVDHYDGRICSGFDIKVDSLLEFIKLIKN